MLQGSLDNRMYKALILSRLAASPCHSMLVWAGMKRDEPAAKGECPMVSNRAYHKFRKEADTKNGDSVLMQFPSEKCPIANALRLVNDSDALRIMSFSFN